ncbi:MAG: hypothetical protein FWB79_06005 [Treponema sp.]|nr:hypothetical protein [Treponema sp.]
MKRKLRLLGIIALAAIIVFSVAWCGGILGGNCTIGGECTTWFAESGERQSTFCASDTCRVNVAIQNATDGSHNCDC